MDIFTLKENHERDVLIEEYESLIWTDRYSDIGDVELLVDDTAFNRITLPIGTRLVIPRSDRVMEIETLESITGDDGKNQLKLTGRSLEALLESRAVVYSITQRYLEVYNYGTPDVLMDSFFYNYCYLGSPEDPNDEIPGAQAYGAWPLSTSDYMPYPSTAIWITQEPESVYESVKRLADTWNLGFKLVRLSDGPELYFHVYPGVDRTSTQSDRDALIFSPDLDNIQNVKVLKSSRIFKNVVICTSIATTKRFYAPYLTGPVSGFERKVHVIWMKDIGDIPEVDGEPVAFGSAEWTAWADEVEDMMYLKAMEYFAEARYIYSFDGEIDAESGITYGEDYNLGDLVELRSDDGDLSVKRVTEQIFVSDGEGDREYPTLSETA